MRKDHYSSQATETANLNYSFRWGISMAGALLALTALVALLFLGFAFSGDIIRETSAASLGLEATLDTPIVLWVATSILLALFAGGFFSARLAAPIPARVARLQSLVIASLFFLSLFAAGSFAQFGFRVATFTQASPSQFRNLLDTAGIVHMNPLTSWQMRAAVQPALDGLTSEDTPQHLAEALTARIVGTTTESPEGYLARKTSISEAAAKRRVNLVRAQVKEAFALTSARSSRIMRYSGLAVFGSILLGSLSAMAGGAVGARPIRRRILGKSDRQATEDIAA